MFKTGVILTIIYSIIYNIVIANQGDYYGTYSTYDDICFKRNVFAWLPLISCVLWFLGCLFFSNNFNNIAKSVFLIIITGFVSCINSIHSSHLNVDTGYQMNMTDTERFQKEEINEACGKVAMICNTIHCLHHTTKTIKDITDVDSWKKIQ